VHPKTNYSKISLIWTNWEQPLVHISEGTNYRSATESMFKEVMNGLNVSF
jgi:hypothetical protein